MSNRWVIEALRSAAENPAERLPELLRIAAKRLEEAAEPPVCDVCGDVEGPRVWSEVEVCRACYEGLRAAQVSGFPTDASEQ